MSNKDRPVYVIDTNILVDYVDVIPGENGEEPYEPTIDLSRAHLIISPVVELELSKFKREKSARGAAAREALRRIDQLSMLSTTRTLDETYNLKTPIEVPGTEQLFSILPVHKNFRDCLPFCPSDDDKDGQIILTAMAASLALRGKRVDGSELPGSIMNERFDNVVLLTNDKGLAARARVRGIRAERYGYKYLEPYTGRREVVVPNEFFAEFYNSPEGYIERAAFEAALPNESPLVANEFIVMTLEDATHPPIGYDPWNNSFFDNIGRYDTGYDTIEKLRYVRSFPTPVKNVGQAIYAEALMDPNVAAVVCTGPAGSGKTYMATIFGYEACRKGDFIGVTVVPCENRSNIGALPGDLDEKMDPDVQPLKNALRNFLLRNDANLKRELSNLQEYGTNKDAPKNGKSKKKARRNDDNIMEQAGSRGSGKRSLKVKLEDRVNSIWDNWFANVPIDSARGRDFAFELAIYDEFQDQNETQADTLIKRIGTDGKIILTGDIGQIHSPYLDEDNNGLVYASRQLFDNPMVAQVHFTEDEIVRHPLVQEIARRQKADRDCPIDE